MTGPRRGWHRGWVLLAAAFAVGAALPGAIRRARAACDCSVDAVYKLADVQKVAGDGDLDAERARYTNAATVIVRFDLIDDEKQSYTVHEEESDDLVFRMSK